MEVIITSLIKFLWIYKALLLIRILLSWFPVNWSNPLLSTLSQLTDPYLNLFRSVLPPIGGLDISPILAFFLLQFVERGLLLAL